MERIVIDLLSDDDGDDVVMLDAASKGGQGGFSELEELGFDPFHHDDLWDGEFDIPLPPPPRPDAEQDELLQFSAGVGRWRQALDADDAGLQPEDQDPLQFDVDFAPNFTDSVREAAADAEIPAKGLCMSGVLELFPDMCPNHVAKLYAEYVGRKTVENIVNLILQFVEEGGSYPKTKQLKRKRAPEDDKDNEDEVARKYTSVDRATVTHDYRVLVRAILSGEFCYTPMQYIDHTLSVSKYHLYPAYQTLEEIERTWNPQNPTYQKLKQPRKINRFYRPDAVEEAINSPSTTPDLLLSLTELRAARMARARTEEQLAAQLLFDQAEKENLEQAKRDGTTQDCSCCYTETPLNRMVICNSETEFHSYCKECPRMFAETQIGQGKHELGCFCTETCKGGFSNDQRKIFLDEKLTVAIDRIEAEAALRLAVIENLESCPFCPFAAEYPPVEETKLFHCQNEFCYQVSCRLCQKESHIPKTCEEFAKENGLSVRRQIEEAMTSALVRACNKCKTPFIKEEGCNKMTCKCGNVQCYICSMSCTYDHFNDPARGGKSGNCPLFDDVEKRHTEEVQRAAKEVLAKVRAEHPEYTEEDLEIRVSENVKSDEEARKKKRHVQPRLPPNFLEFERIIQAAPLNRAVPFNHAMYGQGNAQYERAVANMPAVHPFYDNLPVYLFGVVEDPRAAFLRRAMEVDDAGNYLHPLPPPPPPPPARAPLMNRMLHRLGGPPPRAPAPAPPPPPPAPAPPRPPPNALHALHQARVIERRLQEMERFNRNALAYAQHGPQEVARPLPAPAPRVPQPAADDDDFSGEDHGPRNDEVQIPDEAEVAGREAGDVMPPQVPVPVPELGNAQPPPAVPVPALGLELWRREEWGGWPPRGMCVGPAPPDEMLPQEQIDLDLGVLEWLERPRGRMARVRRGVDGWARRVVAVGRRCVVPGGRVRER